DSTRFPVLYRGPEGLVAAVARRDLGGASRGASTGARAATPSPRPRVAGGGGSAAFGVVRASNVAVAPDVVPPGGTFVVRLDWERTGPVRSDLPYWVHVRADADRPDRWYIRPAWSRVGRHIAEHADGVRYRARSDALPLHGMRDLALLPV